MEGEVKGGGGVGGCEVKEKVRERRYEGERGTQAIIV